MIRLDLEGAPSVAERWAFELLVDLARLLPQASGLPGGIRAVVADTGAGEGDFVPLDGAVRISRRILQEVVEVGGAAAEQRSSARDRHGRVPSSANPLVQHGRERDLPVQGAAQALMATVRTAARGQPVYRLGAWPGDKTWAAAATHDLDLVSGWPVAAGLRWLELLGRGELGRMVSAMGSALGGLVSSPVRRTIAAMLQLEKELGIRSTWFVLAGEPTFASWRRGDITYRVDGPAGRRILEMLVSAGHEIGLHGSFETRDDAELMAAQRERLARVSGKAPEGVRQHFLRFDPGRTPSGASRAGFRYDASHGFADRNAFRLGLADVVPLWHATTKEPIPLEEAPLVWMDRTYTKYRREEDARTWVEDALRLATLCREAGGLWTGLWHPNVAPALGYPGTSGTLRELFRGLLDQNPHVAPLGELVAWRAARRALRGRPGPAGNVELETLVAGEWPVTVEELTSGRSARHRWPEVRRG